MNLRAASFVAPFGALPLAESRAGYASGTPLVRLDKPTGSHKCDCGKTISANKKRCLKCATLAGAIE